MSATMTYTRLHRALARIAREEGLQPHSVRLLVAVLEAGGRIRSDRLETALGDGANGGSSTRRALTSVYESGHAGGVGEDGRHRRPGTRTIVSLTSKGEQAARRVLLLGGTP